MGQRRQELVLALVGVPQFPVELGVLDGDGRSARQVFRHGEVRLVVAVARLGVDERDDAQRLAPHGQRHADVRLQAKLPHDAEQFVVLDGLHEQFVGDLRDDLRPARAEDVPDALRRCRVGREAAVNVVGELHLRRVDVGHGHPPQRAVRLGQIDGRPIRKGRHGEGRHLLKRAVEVHQHGEGGAGVGEEAGRLLGPLALRHVQADADHAERLAVVAGKHLPRTGDPVDAAVLPDVAELDVELAARLQRLPDGGVHRLPVIRVDELLEVVERAAERAGGEAVQRFEAVGPLEVAGADVPVPHAHAPGVQGQPQPLLADGERLPCLPQFGDVGVRPEPVQDLPALVRRAG